MCEGGRKREDSLGAGIGFIMREVSGRRWRWRPCVRESVVTLMPRRWRGSEREGSGRATTVVYVEETSTGPDHWRMEGL